MAAVLPAKRKAEMPLLDEVPRAVSTATIRPGAKHALLMAPDAALVSGQGGQVVPTDEEGAPLAVEVTGFADGDLNGKYVARPEVLLHGRRTYWRCRAEDGSLGPLLLAWQREQGRWAILEHDRGGREPDADALEECPWRAFQLDPLAHPWAWTRLLEASRWAEKAAQLTGYAATSAVSVSATPLTMKAPVRQPAADPSPSSVSFSGFRRLELNGHYSLRQDLMVQAKPTYWETTGRFFLYWQTTMCRWAICTKAELELCKKLQCPGVACQLDIGHFTAPGRWVELVQGAWVPAPVDVETHCDQEEDDPDVISG